MFHKDLRKYKMNYFDVILNITDDRELKLIKCIVNYLNLIIYYHK